MSYIIPGYIKIQKNKDAILKEALEKHINVIKKNKLLLYDDEIESPTCYAALRNNYAFRPNGEIVSCTVDLDSSINTIGNFDNNSVSINKKKIKFLTNKINSSKCKTCRNFFKCEMNSCPLKKIKEEYCNYKAQGIVDYD